VIETAKKGVETFDEILKLKTNSELNIQTLGSRANNAQKILPKYKISTILLIPGRM
jgi:hypothetical protein